MLVPLRVAVAVLAMGAISREKNEWFGDSHPIQAEMTSEPLRQGQSTAHASQSTRLTEQRYQRRPRSWSTMPLHQ
jgi:hypothetical protein